MKERVLVLGVGAVARTKISGFFKSKSFAVNFVDDAKTAGWMLASVPCSIVIVDERHAMFLRDIESRQQHVRRIILAAPGSATHGADSCIHKPLNVAKLSEVFAASVESLGESTTMAQHWESADTSRIAS